MPFHVLLAIAILSAKVGELLSRLIGFPAILGAVLAGVFLGPLGIDIAPGLFSSPSTNQRVFGELAKIGLCILLFRIGTENGLDPLKEVRRQAASVAVIGMVLPLLLGFAASVLFGFSLLTSVFIGATLSATSIGITFPVLSELQVQESREGRIILGAAVLDDVLGLVLLSVLLAAAQPELASIGSVGGALALGVSFVGAGVLLGPWLVERALQFLRRIHQTQLILAFAFSYLLTMGELAHKVGLDMVIGAYAAGLAFSQVEEKESIESGLKPLTDLFSPLFFLLIGASLVLPDFSLGEAGGHRGILYFLLLGIAAFAGKLLCGAGVPREFANKWVVGCGMLPRGEVGLVFAQVALVAGVISQGVFSLLVLLLLVTTCVGPILLKLTWRMIPATKRGG